MRWAIVSAVFVKDVISTVRDRRTLLMTFGLPVLLYPLLMIGASRLQDTQRQAIADRPSRIVVWGEMPAVLGDILRADPALGFDTPCDEVVCPSEVVARVTSGELPLPPRGSDERSRARAARERNRPTARVAQPARIEEISDEASSTRLILDAAARALATRRVDAIVLVGPQLGAQIGQGREGELAVLYDSVTPESVEAQVRMVDRLDRVRLDLLAERERAAALPEGFGRVMWTTVTNVATDERRAGFRLGSLLPFLLISLSLLGGLYPAIELTAGEKERGTLQTLLCAPIRPLEIVTAKFLAVWATSLTTAVVNISSFGLTLTRLLPAEAGSIGVSTLGLALVMLVPITFTTSAVFLAVATLARDFKDGQNFLTPVFMALALPAGLTVLPSMTLDAWTAFVPILNLALGIKATLSGEATRDLMLLVAVSSSLYAVLAVLAAARLFEQEQVLLGSTPSFRSLLLPSRSSDGKPTAGLALGAFAIILVMQFYASTWLQDRPLLLMLLTLQVGLMLLPTLGAVALGGLSPVAALALRTPRPLAVAGAVLIGVSAWSVVMGLVMRVMPPPEGVTKALEDVLQIQNQSVSLTELWLLAALLPAVCEETLFRGLILNGTSRWGRGAAILVSALAFAFAHASIYRVLPTMLLGAVLGYAAWQTRSTLTSMVAHVLNNGMLLTLARHSDVGRIMGWDGSGPPPWPLMATGVIMTGVGLWMIDRSAARAEEGRHERQ